MGSSDPAASNVPSISRHPTASNDSLAQPPQIAPLGHMTQLSQKIPAFLVA